ncbi:MAG TPA: carbohydrate porin [Candidatus Kapabacteria bacterium]|nr:carbohydrate porin [Candidatus Kapabacteria bacterium]
MTKCIFYLAIVSLAPFYASAGFANPSDSTRNLFSDTSLTTFHFQLTTITQAHGAFRATYSGLNSLNPQPEGATSVTSTLFAGIHLWYGASVYFNPELAGGQGLSGVTGIAGFTNGETPRVGSPSPVITIARGYFQQTFALSNRGNEHLADGLNQLAMDMPRNRLTITIGKFALSDFFDNNSYSHDPRTQFQNWALMENGSWDYPANTRGYTYAATIEAKIGDWSARASTAAEPTEANGPTLEYRNGAHGETIELEHRHNLIGDSGVVRLLLFNNTADMGNYDLAVSNPSFDTDVTKTRQYGRDKYGIGLNAEQALSPNIGAFLRAGWSDGRNETWAFTEIDRTASLGFSFNGALWKREKDVAGIAGVINGLSGDHRRYLAGGGYGFIIGDGALHYAPESIVEVYYLIALTDVFALTADYQFVANPAYNADRGPVNIIGVRAHVEI